jgi:hypothetical protein
LAEISCENNSGSSLNSDHSQLDESEDPDSLKEADSDSQSYNSGLDSVSSNLGYDSQECIGQVVRVFFSLKECARLNIARIIMLMMAGVSGLEIKIHVYIKTQ